MLKTNQSTRHLGLIANLFKLSIWNIAYTYIYMFYMGFTCNADQIPNIYIRGVFFEMPHFSYLILKMGKMGHFKKLARDLF